MKMYTARNIYTLLIAALLAVAPVVHAAPGPCGCCLKEQAAPAQHEEASCCTGATTQDTAPVTVSAVTGHTCRCSMQSHSPTELPPSVSLVTGPEACSSLLGHVPDWATTSLPPAREDNTPPLREPRLSPDGYLEVCRLLI